MAGARAVEQQPQPRGADGRRRQHATRGRACACADAKVGEAAAEAAPRRGVEGGVDGRHGVPGAVQRGHSEGGDGAGEQAVVPARGWW